MGVIPIEELRASIAAESAMEVVSKMVMSGVGSDN
jgi:hypothetical protein